MLKIGDFSKLTHVSIRMLRHYDEMGLLAPTHIDPVSGYRYYTADQLPQLNRILALQDLGLSLKQIAELLSTPLSLEQMRGMLIQKQAELADHVREAQERLQRVQARLEDLESPAPLPSLNTVIKQVPTVWVASVRDTIERYDGINRLYSHLFQYLAPMRIEGLTAAIWHDDSYIEAGIDAEALIYLTEPIPSSATVKVYQLVGAKMASIVHHGSFNRLPHAYNTLTRWLDRSGYHISGPNRELYLAYSMPARSDDDSYVTELQFPVVFDQANPPSSDPV